MHLFFRLLLIVTSWGVSFGSLAHGIEFSKGSWNEILSKARAEQKFIFVDVYADWCKPCKWMEKEVFSDPKVAEYMNAHFVSLRVDAENDQTGLAGRWKVEVYPSLFFVNPAGEILIRNEGILDAVSFEEAARSIVSLGEIEESYLKNKKDAKSVADYTLALKWLNPQKAGAIAKGYLSDAGTKKLKDPDNWRMIQNFISADDRVIFPEVIKRDELAELYPQEFTAYMQKSLGVLIDRSVSMPNGSLLKKYLYYLNSMADHFGNVDSLAHVARLRYAQKTGSKNFLPLLKDYVSEHHSASRQSKLAIAQTLVGQYYTENILEYAIDLAKNTNDEYPTADAYRIMALAYDKMNRYRMAYAHLLMASEFATGEMVDELNRLEPILKERLEKSREEGVNTLISEEGADDGRFTLGAGRRRLMYGYPVPNSTSHFVLSVNNQIASNASHFDSRSVTRLLGKTVITGEGATPKVRIAFTFEGVEVTQTLTPVDKDGKEILQGLAQYYMVSYELKNLDQQFKKIGLACLFDTMIDDNDFCTISADGRLYQQEVAFNAKTFMPRELLFYRTTNDTSDHMGAAIIRGLSSVPPDNLFIGNWPKFHGMTKDFFAGNQRYHDSAFVLEWTNRRLKPYESISFVTYYGLPEHKRPELRILMQSDHVPEIRTSLYFEIGSDRLDLNAKMKLSELVERDDILITGVLLNGYTDVIGQSDYNFDLSIRRIKKVGQIFRAHDISFVPKPYGLNQSDTNGYNLLYGNNWDRRVDVIVYYQKRSEAVRPF